jgi:S-adenosylmethionine/arginine decarboxylase-like enzyme
MVVHKHLIVRAEVKNPIIDPEKAIEWLGLVVKQIGMTITEHGGPYADYVKKDGNEGIAAIAMIETSHVSLHVWDKDDPPLAQIDIYSCAEFDHEAMVDMIDEEMKVITAQHICLNRATGIELFGARIFAGKGAKDE